MKADGKKQITDEANIIRLSAGYPNVRAFARKPGCNIFKVEWK